MIYWLIFVQVACGGGHADIVQLLCEARANLETEDDEGQTPYSAAIAGGYPDIAQSLEWVAFEETWWNMAVQLW